MDAWALGSGSWGRMPSSPSSWGEKSKVAMIYDKCRGEEMWAATRQKAWYSAVCWAGVRSVTSPLSLVRLRWAVRRSSDSLYMCSLVRLLGIATMYVLAREAHS